MPQSFTDNEGKLGQIGASIVQLVGLSRLHARFYQGALQKVQAFFDKGYRPGRFIDCAGKMEVRLGLLPLTKCLYKMQDERP